LSKDDILLTIYPLKYLFFEQEQRKDKELMAKGGKRYDSPTCVAQWEGRFDSQCSQV
jgi:hypothetical protein